MVARPWLVLYSSTHTPGGMMTLHCRIHTLFRWRARRGVRRWLAWIIGGMVVGLGLAGGLLVASSPGARAQAAAPPPLRNALATAQSPYLRSAAQQPVAWQQWDPQRLSWRPRSIGRSGSTLGPSGVIGVTSWTARVMRTLPSRRCSTSTLSPSKWTATSARTSIPAI